MCGRPAGWRVLADRARPGSRLPLHASVAGLGGGISWRSPAYSLFVSTSSTNLNDFRLPQPTVSVFKQCSAPSEIEQGNIVDKAVTVRLWTWNRSAGRSQASSKAAPFAMSTAQHCPFTAMVKKSFKIHGSVSWSGSASKSNHLVLSHLSSLQKISSSVQPELLDIRRQRFALFYWQTNTQLQKQNLTGGGDTGRIVSAMLVWALAGQYNGLGLIGQGLGLGLASFGLGQCWCFRNVTNCNDSNSRWTLTNVNVCYVFSYLYHFCVRFYYGLRWNYWPGLHLGLALGEPVLY